MSALDVKIGEQIAYGSPSVRIRPPGDTDVAEPAIASYIQVQTSLPFDGIKARNFANQIAEWLLEVRNDVIRQLQKLINDDDKGYESGSL